ncbi:ester hydrolase C11orf54 homolog [Polyergus mexicanus]|uniref:ester hydrolase C11orf54 homolog n=1 Tax=Polyergus mexicanus TaxID=615972 RepID=UPI0038B68C95
MAHHPHPVPVGNNPPENEDDIRLEGNAFGGNNDLEDENVIPDDNVFRRIDYFADENANYFLPNDNEFKAFDRQRDINEPGLFIGYRLFPFTLVHIKNVLYVGLHALFNEFEIRVVSCPCLTRPPYDLAAVGLSGNASYLRVGGLYNLLPNPQTDITYDIRSELLRYCYDTFIIGTGYAAKPSMLYNGLLTMNATVLPPENVNNNSRIVYENNIGHLQLKEITDSNQMICSILGNFFFSEGKPGKVIQMRAKGRKFPCSIVSIIQTILLRYCQSAIVLGGVFLINGGKAQCLITPEDYPEILLPHNIYTWLKSYQYDCKNIVAVGALSNTMYEFIGQLPDGNMIIDSRYKFHIFSKNEPAGIFENDITAEETEYIGYFNIAQTAYL